MNAEILERFQHMKKTTRGVRDTTFHDFIDPLIANMSREERRTTADELYTQWAGERRRRLIAREPEDNSLMELAWYLDP